MSRSGPLKFKRIHINYVTVAPILEILFEPDAIASPFSFFTNLDNYIAYYRHFFLQSHRLRKGRKVRKRLRHPFVKGLGELVPLAGHEVKNLPLYKAMGGNISYVLGYLKDEGGMLPMKLFPNWKIRLDSDILEFDDLLTRYDCSPLIKIYPFGMISYQTRIYLASEQGMNLGGLITLMRSIKERHVLITHRGKFSASSLMRNFHEIVLKNFVARTVMRPDSRFSPLHRILTIDHVDGRLSPDASKKELAAMVGLMSRWDKLSKPYVDGHLGKSFTGILEDQFFFFHPSCTIIYPSSPAHKPEFNSYVRGCIRTNFISLVEATTLQSQFARVLRQPLKKLLNESPYTLERKADLLPLLDRIKGVEWLLSKRCLTRWLRGAHKRFCRLVERTIGLEKRVTESLKTLKRLRVKMQEVIPTLSVHEQVELGTIVSHLDEIAKVCRVFVENNPFQLSEHVVVATALMASAQRTRNTLLASKGQYNSLVTGPFPDQQKIFNLKSYIYQLVFTDYRTDILPKFENFVQQVLNKENQIKKIAEEKRAQGISVSTPVETDQALKEAKEELASATQESPASQTFPEIASFASKAKPYVEKLVKVARTVLTVMGFFI